MNEFSDSGFTALHVACDRDMVDMANYLVLKGASLEAKDAKGRTPVDVCGSIGLDDLADWDRKSSSKNHESSVSSDHENVSKNRFSMSATEEDNDLLKVPENGVNPVVENNVYEIKTSKEDLAPIDGSESAIESIASPSELSVHQKIKDLNMRIGHQPMPPSLLSAIRAPSRRASTPNRYRQQYEATCNEHDRTVRSSRSNINVGPLVMNDDESRASSISSEDFRRNKNSFIQWEKMSEKDRLAATHGRRGSLVDLVVDSPDKSGNVSPVTKPNLANGLVKNTEENRANSVVLPEDFTEGEKIESALAGMNGTVRCPGGSPLNPFTPAVSPQDPKHRNPKTYSTTSTAASSAPSSVASTPGVIKLDALDGSTSPGVSLSPAGLRRYKGRTKENDTDTSPVGSPDAADSVGGEEKSIEETTEESDYPDTFLTQPSIRNPRLIYSEGGRGLSDDFFSEDESEGLDNASSEVKTSTTASHSTFSMKDSFGYRSRGFSDSHFSDRLSNVSNASTVQIGFSSSFVSSASMDQEDSTIKYNAYSPEAFKMNQSDRIPPTIPAAIRRLSVDCGEVDSVSQWLLRGEAAMHSPRDSFQEALARHELLAAGSPVHDRGSAMKHMPSQFAMSKDKKPKTLSYILNNSYGSNMGSDSDGESISSGWSWSAAKGRESIEVQTEAVLGLKRSETTFSEEIDNAADVAAEKVTPYITSRRGSKVIEESSDGPIEEMQQGEEEEKNLLEPKSFEEQERRQQEAEELDTYEPYLGEDKVQSQQQQQQEEEEEEEDDVLEDSDTYEPLIIKVHVSPTKQQLKQEVEELDACEPYSMDTDDQLPSPSPLYAVEEEEQDEEKVEEENKSIAEDPQSLKESLQPPQVDQDVEGQIPELLSVDKEQKREPVVHLHAFKRSPQREGKEGKDKMSPQPSPVKEQQQQQQQQQVDAGATDTPHLLELDTQLEDSINVHQPLLLELHMSPGQLEHEHEQHHSIEGLTIRPFSSNRQEKRIGDECTFPSTENSVNKYEQGVRTSSLDSDDTIPPNISEIEEVEDTGYNMLHLREPVSIEKNGQVIKLSDISDGTFIMSETLAGGETVEKSNDVVSVFIEQGVVYDERRDMQRRDMQDRIFVLEAKLADSQHTELLATVAAVASATQLDNETMKHRESIRILSANMRDQLTEKENEITTLSTQLRLATTILTQAGENAKISTKSQNDLENRAMLALEKLESQLRVEAEARLVAEQRALALEIELSLRVSSPKGKGSKRLTPSSTPLKSDGIRAPYTPQNAVAATHGLSVSPSSLASLLVIYKKLGEVLQEQSSETLAYIDKTADQRSVKDGQRSESGKSNSQKSEADVLVTFDVIYPLLKGHLNGPAPSRSPESVKGAEKGMEKGIERGAERGVEKSWEGTPSLHGIRSSTRSSSASLSPSNLMPCGDSLEGRKGQGNNGEAKFTIPDFESRSFTASPSLENILFVEDNPFINSPILSNMRRREGFDKSVSSQKKFNKSPVHTDQKNSPHSTSTPGVCSISYEENPLLMAVERHLIERRGMLGVNGSPILKTDVRDSSANNYVVDFISEIEHEQRQGEKLDVLLELNDIPDFDEGDPFAVDTSVSSHEQRERDRFYNGEIMTIHSDTMSIPMHVQEQKSSKFDYRELFVEPIDNQASAGLTLIGRRSQGKRSEHVQVPILIQQDDYLNGSSRKEQKNLNHTLDAEMDVQEMVEGIRQHEMYVSPTIWDDQFSLSDSPSIMLQKEIFFNTITINQTNSTYEEHSQYHNITTNSAPLSHTPSELELNIPSPGALGPLSPQNPFFTKSSREHVHPLDSPGGVRTSPKEVNIFESAFHTPGKKRIRKKNEALFSIPDTFSGYSLLSHSLDDIPNPLEDSDTSTNSYPEVHSDIYEQEQEQGQGQQTLNELDRHDEVDSAGIMTPWKGKTTVFNDDMYDAYVGSQEADSDDLFQALISPQLTDSRRIEELSSIRTTVNTDRSYTSKSELRSKEVCILPKESDHAVTYVEEIGNDVEVDIEVEEDLVDEEEGEEESWSGYSSQAERMVMLKLDWALATVCSALHTLQERIRNHECHSPHTHSLLQLADNDKKGEAFRRLKEHVLTPKDLLALGSNPPAIASMMKSNEPALWAIFLRYGPLGQNKFTLRSGEEVRRQPTRKCRRLSTSCAIDLFSDFELCADVKS